MYVLIQNDVFFKHGSKGTVVRNQVKSANI